MLDLWYSSAMAKTKPIEILCRRGDLDGSPPVRCECGHLERSHALGLCRVHKAGDRFGCGCTEFRPKGGVPK